MQNIQESRTSSQDSIMAESQLTRLKCTLDIAVAHLRTWILSCSPEIPLNSAILCVKNPWERHFYLHPGIWLAMTWYVMFGKYITLCLIKGNFLF